MRKRRKKIRMSEGNSQLASNFEYLRCEWNALVDACTKAAYTGVVDCPVSLWRAPRECQKGHGIGFARIMATENIRYTSGSVRRIYVAKIILNPELTWATMTLCRAWRSNTTTASRQHRGSSPMNGAAQLASTCRIC